jgi:hypothetical protein
MKIMFQTTNQFWMVFLPMILGICYRQHLFWVRKRWLFVWKEAVNSLLNHHPPTWRWCMERNLGIVDPMQLKKCLHHVGHIHIHICTWA